MNKKITFYCTSLEYGIFTKTVFETVLANDEIDSLDDVKDWVDDNIQLHYNEFGLNLVFDWVVLSCTDTVELAKETEIVRTLKGVLMFEDSNDYHYFKLGKVVSEKNKAKAEIKEIKKASKPKVEEKKEYPSVWIDTSGEVFRVGFANHNEFACDWLKENDEEAYNRVLHAHSRYYYEELQDLGWIRILGWRNPPDFVITQRVTPKQRIALKNYCLNNEVPYNAFHEILKA